MATQIITLTAAGINSGPNYDVYWSPDCVNYTLLTGSSPVFLPAVGFTASIEVPINTTCVKLQNNNSNCNNELVRNVIVCPTSTTTIGPCGGLTVGSSYGGGKVFAIVNNMVYIAAENDLTQSNGSPLMSWGCQNTYINGATGSTWGEGYQNSLDIVAGCASPNIAARVALSASINGYDDWYLPTLDELQGLWAQRGLSPFISSSVPYYWTSRQWGASTATSVAAITGNESNANTKGNTYRVKAIRAIPCADFTTTTTTTLSITTTTTVSPTTTTTVSPTTTTTVSPTTTTTTTAAPCLCYYIQNETAGVLYYEYIDCVNGYQNLPLSGGGIVRVCSQDYPSGTGLTIVPCSDITVCNNSSECTGCTFGTQTTTTTTLSPTTTTTTIGYDYYEADEYLCDGCVFQQSNVCVAFPAGTSIVTANRYYHPDTPTGFVYKNFTLLGSPCSPAIIMTTLGNSTNCANACGLTTTTTTTLAPTTTTLSPTTTTTIAPTTTTTTQACVTSVSFEVDSAGDVRYVDCCGNTIYLTFGIGPQVINDCLQNGSLFGVGATISFVTYGSTSCTCPPTTTTIAPTTTTTLAPTTTTTAAPPPTTTTTAVYYYSALLCGGSTMEYFRSTDPSLPDHCNVIYGWCTTCGGGSYQCFDNVSPSAVSNTNDVIACYDSCQECSAGPTTTLEPTTTLSPTTTTTIAPTTTVSYDFYDADYYDCNDCAGGVVGTILVAFAAGSSVTLNRFYQPAGGPDGFAYKVTGTASSGVAYILTTAFGSSTTCGLACSV